MSSYLNPKLNSIGLGLIFALYGVAFASTNIILYKHYSLTGDKINPSIEINNNFIDADDGSWSGPDAAPVQAEINSNEPPSTPTFTGLAGMYGPADTIHVLSNQDSIDPEGAFLSYHFTLINGGVEVSRVNGVSALFDASQLGLEPGGTYRIEHYANDGIHSSSSSTQSFSIDPISDIVNQIWGTIATNEFGTTSASNIYNQPGVGDMVQSLVIDAGNTTGLTIQTVGGSGSPYILGVNDLYRLNWLQNGTPMEMIARVTLSDVVSPGTSSARDNVVYMGTASNGQEIALFIEKGGLAINRFKRYGINDADPNITVGLDSASH